MKIKKKRKNYSRDFKQAAVAGMEEVYQDPERTIEEYALNLGVHLSLLYRWRDALQDQLPEDAFPGKGHQSSTEDELTRLRRENEQLRQERDFLRKAAAYFAQE